MVVCFCMALRSVTSRELITTPRTAGSSSRLFTTCSQVAPGAILVRHPELQGRVKPGLSGPRRTCPTLDPCRPDVRCRMRWSLSALRAVAHHLLDRRACVADGAVGFEDRDDIGAVLYQGAEALLALYDYSLDLLTLGDVLDLGDVSGSPSESLTRKRSAKPTPCGHRRGGALLQVVPGELACQYPARISLTGLKIVRVGDLLPREGLQLFLGVPEYSQSEWFTCKYRPRG